MFITKYIEESQFILLSAIQSNNKMHYNSPFFRFGGGGGPNGPNLAKQLLMIFGAWTAAKIYVTQSKGPGGRGRGGGSYPMIIAH